MNKITWARNIHGQGRAFVVHPDAFMVHQPHPESCAKAMWRVGKPGKNSVTGVIQGKLLHLMSFNLTRLGVMHYPKHV